MTALEKEIAHLEMVLGTECTCHICAPCGFCEGLSEQEADLWHESGRKGLYALLWSKRELLP